MNKINRKFLINYIIGFVIYLLFAFALPTFSSITRTGMMMLGIVFQMIWGLITIGPVVPSLTAIVLAAFSNYFGNGIQGIIMEMGSNYVCTMCLCLMMFAGVLSASGLAKGLAQKIVYSKLANGKPWVLTALIMIASAVPSMFLTALPVVFIMFDIVDEIYELVGYQKGDKWPMIMSILVTFSALVGMTCMPFNIGVAGDFSILLTYDPEAKVNPGMFIISSLVLAAVLLILAFLATRYLVKPDVSNLKNYTSQYEIQFDKKQKTALVLLIFLAVMVVLPDCVPAGGVKDFLNMFGAAGAAVFVVLIACVLRNSDGTAFLNFEDIAGQGVIWPMLLMIGTLNVVCGTLSNDDVGVVESLKAFLEPLVEGMSPFAFFVLFVIIVYAATNIFDGAVVAYVAIPIMYVIAPMVGLTATGMMAVMTHNIQSGLVLPSASPSASVMFGKADDNYWYNRKQATKYGFMFAIIYTIGMLLVYYPFVKLM